ncbi:MAG: DnaJ domain-containing protein [Chloroflexota bacterium]|nr:MAG: DnaJ domain-containing protein [Chloroflexota bacterium]
MKRLRLAVKQAQEELATAEASLAARQGEIRAIERRLRFRLGRSLDRLAELEEQVESYRRKIQQLRMPDAYEAGYLPVEEQYRRTWQRAADDDIYAGADPLAPADDQQLKRLYRRLARRYHPDLAADESEQKIRTDKMAALNEAYASGSLVEMIALDETTGEASSLSGAGQHTDIELAQALESEMARLSRKIRLVQNEIDTLHNNPVVQLSLDVKLARRRGRDLVQEMSVDIDRRIVRATAKRDELKARLERMRR